MLQGKVPTPGAQRASSCTPSPGPRVGSNAPDLENIEASRLKPCVPAPAGSSPWPAAEEEAGCSVLSPHGGSRSSRGGLCFSFLLTKSAVDKQEMSSEQQQALSLLSPAPLTFKEHPAQAKSVLASQPRGYRAPARPGHRRGGRWRQCWPGPAAGLIGRVPGQGVLELALAAGRGCRFHPSPPCPQVGVWELLGRWKPHKAHCRIGHHLRFFFPSAPQGLMPRRI